MIKSLRKAVVYELENKIASAFTKVGSDIEHINGWIEHLYDSQSKLHSHHSEHVNLTRKDVANLNKWINYLHQHHSDLNKELRDLSRYLHESTAVSKELMKRLEKIEEESREMKSALAALRLENAKRREGSHEAHPQVRTEVRTEPRTRSELEPEKSGSGTKFAQRVVRKVMQNKRQIVINEMLRIIDSQHPSTKELEKIIVEEKELCGRTTFYSYLKELRDREKITDERKVDGTNIISKVK